ncbi:hypothetical protein V3C99_013921 [Haemonchus contortus]
MHHPFLKNNMLKFDNCYIEQANVASEIDTGQVSIVKKQKNEGLIARLRSRLHRKIISAFRLSLLVKSKQSQPVETPSRVPPVLFAPVVQPSIEKPSRKASRMCSLRSILEHSSLSTPTSRLITPPPSADLSPVDEPEKGDNASIAESILSWDRSRRRNHEEDTSSMSICSNDSLTMESSSLSECSYRVNSSVALPRTMSAPLLYGLEVEDIVYVDESLRQNRPVTPIERKELNFFMFRAKSR